MRETQYIGLTFDACEWVEENRIEKYRNYEMTTGMFGEVVHGRIYDLTPPEGPNIRYYAKEVVQASPWSSGPMIFTCLELILVKENGQEISQGRIFEWVANPSIKGEFDQAKGHYWV